MALADQLLVMSQGRIVAESTRHAPRPKKIGLLMTGGKAA